MNLTGQSYQRVERKKERDDKLDSWYR